MASANKFNSFVEDVMKKKIDVSADSLMIGLWVPGSPTPPNAADTVVDTTTTTCTLKANTNILEIAAGNGYTKKGTAITVTTSSQTSGTFTLAGNQVVFTASGGAIANFRYIVLFDDTSGTTATRSVIMWWDYGSTVTLNSGDTFTVKFNNASPGTILTLV